MSDCIYDQSHFIQITQDNFNAIFSKFKTNDVKLLTLHWSVGTYSELWSPYHLNIDGAGNMWLNKEAYDTDGTFQKLAHAYNHNTANFGITLDGMWGAEETDTNYLVDPNWNMWPSQYGHYTPTKVQMDNMCWFIYKLLVHYTLDISQVFTHYDLSLVDGYKGQRWEFRYEKPIIIQQVERYFQP